VFYLIDAFLDLFSEYALIVEERASLRARSQFILSVEKPLKISCPTVLNLFNTFKMRPPENTDAGKPTKICRAVTILGNMPETACSSTF
jgi:hypothetical protein